MWIRFFGSSDCKECLKFFVILNRHQVEYKYIDAIDDNDDIQMLCDKNNVEELPHIQFILDEDQVVVEHIGPLHDKEFIEYLVDYFPDY